MSPFANSKALSRRINETAGASSLCALFCTRTRQRRRHFHLFTSGAEELSSLLLVVMLSSFIQCVLQKAQRISAYHINHVLIHDGFRNGACDYGLNAAEIHHQSGCSPLFSQLSNHIMVFITSNSKGHT